VGGGSAEVCRAAGGAGASASTGWDGAKSDFAKSGSTKSVSPIGCASGTETTRTRALLSLFWLRYMRRTPLLARRASELVTEPFGHL